MIDYLISTGLAALSAAALLHLWFRTSAFVEYAELLGSRGVADIATYKEWAKARLTAWLEATKAKAPPADASCPTCAAAATTAGRTRAMPDQPGRVPASTPLPPPETSYPAWLATFRSRSFFARLLTCHHCIGLWFAIAAALMFRVPLAVLAIYLLALYLYELPGRHAR